MSPAEIETSLRRFFGADPRDATAVYLFGSVARGTCTKESDVDVGVLYEQAPPRTFEGMPFGLEADLESLLGRQVQVVVLNGAPPDLLRRVIRDGKLVLDRDRAARLQFEVKAQNEYFDLEPYLKLYRQKNLGAPSPNPR